MPDWDAILVELRTIRASMDRIAVLAAGEQAREDLLPIYDCGHRHISRGQAIACKRLASADIPPKAEAGAFE